MEVFLTICPVLYVNKSVPINRNISQLNAIKAEKSCKLLEKKGEGYYISPFSCMVCSEMQKILR